MAYKTMSMVSRENTDSTWLLST